MCMKTKIVQQVSVGLNRRGKLTDILRKPSFPFALSKAYHEVKSFFHDMIYTVKLISVAMAQALNDKSV